MSKDMETISRERAVRIDLGTIQLQGDLAVPGKARGIVLFAHGSGSSRLSSRNRYVARFLQNQGLATLLFDLLTQAEEKVDDVTMQLRFDIPLLAKRLSGATRWLSAQSDIRALSVGYFGASTGGAAALVAENMNQGLVKAIVSRGGRPDLAGPALDRVQAPTLLIVGGNDDQVIQLNEQAMDRLKSMKKLIIVPGATHLFEEPGTLESVSELAADWFRKYLSGA